MSTTINSLPSRCKGSAVFGMLALVVNLNNSDLLGLCTPVEYTEQEFYTSKESIQNKDLAARSNHPTVKYEIFYENEHKKCR